MTKKTGRTEQAINAVLERFTEAWNTHDAKAYANLFAVNADFTNVFGQTFHGRVAIEAQHAPIFATIFKDSRITSMKPTVRLIDQIFAAVDVTWTMSGAIDMIGNSWGDRKGLMNLVMKFDNDEWFILIMHNMDLPVISAN
ncbi:SgcJ/EcaC family oxidoreductase [Panacibacter ginsenosidivorans]|uniref:SgcJ/EcaC family oxidoreductase n=1 Tax=Panacibacter ginsenosidivorans TaxID=1813871 RepID=A0A5B8VDK7_9BACT|nr:SgcJ/EcaC family oxidoreductase [Panacibacter ginsenosidivorans]QEC68726.1 SgcJ/EcaC family oxidoreductase [Panacibacter ginsenosidivorans]